MILSSVFFAFGKINDWEEWIVAGIFEAFIWLMLGFFVMMMMGAGIA